MYTYARVCTRNSLNCFVFSTSPFADPSKLVSAVASATLAPEIPIQEARHRTAVCVCVVLSVALHAGSCNDAGSCSVPTSVCSKANNGEQRDEGCVVGHAELDCEKTLTVEAPVSEGCN